MFTINCLLLARQVADVPETSEICDGVERIQGWRIGEGHSCLAMLNKQRGHRFLSMNPENRFAEKRSYRQRPQLRTLRIPPPQRNRIRHDHFFQT